mmetsp:Transcript_2913/g.5460  ORF Transcript_2913/g.5460 Transcript_2913/m.5460 type:complete len:419 (+) Transcript_2913:48-1304(+)
MSIKIPTNDQNIACQLPMWIVCLPHGMISNVTLVLLLKFMGVNMAYALGCATSNLFPLGSKCYSCRTYRNTFHSSFGSRLINNEHRDLTSNLAKYKHAILALNQSKQHEFASGSDFSHKDTSTKSYYEAAEHAVILLAQKSRTWKRLAHIVELSTCTPRKYQYRSIADIGCDHGLLSIALASTGKFQNVIGIDVSNAALENGAKKFYSKALHAIGGIVENQFPVDDGQVSKGATQESSKPFLPVEFRIGDGLLPLNLGEADAICMAGIGVDTILSILEQSMNHSGSNSRVLDSLHCNSLFVQPPNSRPRKLMELYDNFHKMGFTLANERIMKLKERYYITSHFDRKDTYDNLANDINVIPGNLLRQSPDVEQRHMYKEFVDHHYRWVQQDLERNGDLWDYDKLWIESNLEWNTICPYS